MRLGCGCVSAGVVAPAPKKAPEPPESSDSDDDLFVPSTAAPDSDDDALDSYLRDRGHREPSEEADETEVADTDMAQRRESRASRRSAGADNNDDVGDGDVAPLDLYGFPLRALDDAAIKALGAMRGDGVASVQAMAGVQGG